MRIGLALVLLTGCTVNLGADARLDDLTVRQARDEQRLDTADRNFQVLMGEIQKLAQKVNAGQKE